MMAFLPIGTTVELGGQIKAGQAVVVDVLPRKRNTHPAKLWVYYGPDCHPRAINCRVDRMVCRRQNGKYVVVPDSPTGWRSLNVIKESLDVRITA